MKLDNFDKVFAAVFILTVVLRFSLSSAVKAPWWDEASFMVMVREFTGDKYCSWEDHRLPGLPLLLAPVSMIFGFAYGNFQFFSGLLSLAAILTLYLLTSKFFNKTVALSASTLLSFSWINLFYGTRVFSRIPASLLLLLFVYLFWVGWEKKDKKRLICAGLAWALYAMARFDAYSTLIAVGLYLLYTERLGFMRKKEFYFLAGSCVLFYLPYLVWSQLTFGNPLHQLRANYVYSISHGPEDNFWWYFNFNNMSHILGSPVLTVLLYAAFIWFFAEALGNKLSNKTWFAFALVAVHILQLSFALHHEDRYLLVVLPFMLVCISLFVESWLVKHAAGLLKFEKHKTPACLILAALLAYLSFSYGSPIITDRGASYSSVMLAGQFLSTSKYTTVVNTPFSMSYPAPQLCVWAKKNWLPPSKSLAEFKENLKAPNSVGYYAFPYEGDLTNLSIGNFINQPDPFKPFLDRLYANGLKLVELFPNIGGRGGFTLLLELNETNQSSIVE